MSEVKIDEMVTDEVAVVEVSTYVNDYYVSAKGWSKKHPKDNPDPELGRTLALARALQDLSEKIDYAAQEMIDNPLLVAVAAEESTISVSGIYPRKGPENPSISITGRLLSTFDSKISDLGRR